VARLASERKVDLAQVKGTGAGGRITKQDVVTYIEQMESTPPPEAAPWETPGEGDLFRPTELMFPQQGQKSEAKEGVAKAETPVQEPAKAPVASQPPSPAPVQPGISELLPLTSIRKSIAEHMVLSSRTSPHVTTVMEADMSAITAHRQANKEAFARDGANLTFSAYFIAAAVAALKAHPIVNSSFSEEGIRLHRQINIGMAASLGEEGLIVPVIKNADGLSLLGIARAVNDLAERARSRRLQPDEVKGGTFTITNHGTGGSLFATPIINQPQSSILGVGLIQKRVVVINDAIAIRPMAYLSLSFDHRILDGASADGFLSRVVETLEKWV
jgi:2-oxoglutarate dehydrogenase E2 component (dihydrolipoamide succinyltransferase)